MATTPQHVRSPAHRSPGRPSAAVLTREVIAASAYRLLCTSGPANLRMKQLAAQLGVQPPSLYNHIAGKSELLNLVRDYVAASIDVAALNLRPWPEAIRRWARSYIAAFAPLHPETTSAIAVLPMGDQPRVMGMYEQFVTLLTEAGWPHEAVLPTLIALESFCIGTVHDLAAPAGYTAPSDALLTPSYAQIYAQTDSPSQRAADLGIDLLIRGMEQQHAEFSSRS